MDVVTVFKEKLDVVDYVFDISQLSLPTPFYSVLVSVSVFVIFSTVFHSALM